MKYDGNRLGTVALMGDRMVGMVGWDGEGGRLIRGEVDREIGSEIKREMDEGL